MIHYTLKQKTYQRNGVSGQGFFVILFDYKERDDNYKDLILTIADGDIQQARVVNPSDLEVTYRGDEIGNDIWTELERVSKEIGIEVYDYITFPHKFRKN